MGGPLAEMMSSESPIRATWSAFDAEVNVDSRCATRSLQLNFSWTLFGNIIYAGTQWGTLVLLARLGSPEAVGQFSLGLAVTAPIMLFASLQLRAVQATDSRFQFETRDYAGLRILLTVAAACVIFGFSGGLYRGETALTIAAFAMAKSVESFSDTVYGLWQQRERMDLIAKSLIWRGILALALAGVIFAIWHTVWIAVCGIAVAWAWVLAAFDIPHGLAVAHETGQTAAPRFCVRRMKQMLRLALPLGFVTMLISLSANVPRYMINDLRGARELGVFSALSYLLIAGTMIVSALGQSATPRLALYASVGDQLAFSRLTRRLLLAGLGFGVACILAASVLGRQIVTLIYGPDYVQSQRLFVWLMVAGAAGYIATCANYCLMAARRFQIQLPLFAFVALLTLVLCYVMTKAGGAVGAAKALAVVALVQLALTLGILRFTEIREPEHSL